jgi:hypothetical protein
MVRRVTEDLLADLLAAAEVLGCRIVVVTPAGEQAAPGCRPQADG